MYWGRRARYDGRSRFVQNGFEKKQADSSREDWRDRKGFAKDQSKHRAWCKCGRYLKRIGNRKERRWTSKMIHSERWDQLYYHQDHFVSSWDAC